jgi:exopolysaccharide biosynthesis polyprenyl glycosylphosphotransferase
MIKEQNKFFKRVQVLSDLSIVMLAFFIGYYLRDKTLDIYPFNLLENYLYDEKLRAVRYYAIYMGLLPVLLVIWGSLLNYFGMYKSAGIVRIPDALRIVLKTTFVGFILFGSYIFVLRMQEDVSRLFIGFVFVIAAIFISIEKIILVMAFKAISNRETSFKSALFIFTRVLVVGTNKRARNLISLVKKHPDWGIRIAGVVDIDPSKKGESISGYEVVGSLDDIPDIISHDVVDEVVFIVPRSWLSRIENAMLYCESAGLKVNLAVNLFDLKFSNAKQTDLFGFPLLTFENASSKVGQLFIKRVFDFVAAGLGLIVLSPLFIIVIILIKMTSEGPIFFKQLRCGMYGRKFVFYKFRTMIADAESKLKDLLKYNEMDGPVFKMQNDPRITKVGKVLRKFSIDELPQLWNVVKGDMSLVGPRPPIPHEVDKYDIWQRRRLSMRPGITCLWQTAGRNQITNFSDWLKLDLEYIDNWSMWLDFKILFKTLPAVLFGTGAK